MQIDRDIKDIPLNDINEIEWLKIRQMEPLSDIESAINQSQHQPIGRSNTHETNDRFSTVNAESALTAHPNNSKHFAASTVAPSLGATRLLDFAKPPATTDDYRAHVLGLAGVLGRIPLDDRADLLQTALLRAVPRWDPARSPWHPWIVTVLSGEVARYWRAIAARPYCPLPDDLPAPDQAARTVARIDLGLLLDRLPPRQRRAIMAHSGGGAAHRARLRLRQLAKSSR